MAEGYTQGALVRGIYILIGVAVGFGAHYVLPFLQTKEPEVKTPAMTVGGSSVVFFIMDKWKSAYHKEKGLQLAYRSSGSTQGVKETINKAYQVGFTSSRLTPEQRKEAEGKGGELVQIPIVMIAVVPVYDLPSLKDKPPLKFTGEVLGRIFLGKITKWNDPALKELNPGVELPDLAITVVHRKDSSGTTATFTEYLEETSETWKKEKLGSGASVKWPIGEAIERNHGVAGRIANRPDPDSGKRRNPEGAIGYVELLNAHNAKLSHGAVQNREKAFIQASPDTVTAAAKGVKVEDFSDPNFKLINRPGKDVYPICSIDWAVCYQTQPPGSYRQIVEFLSWATHAGQKYCKDMQYAPLPEELVHVAEKQIQTVKLTK